MVSFFVVFDDSGSSDFAYLIEIAEQSGVEYFVPIRTVEAFDKCVLIRLSWFDVVERDAYLHGG
jgi:hypothetical protein